jgi:hypothetical protein
MKLKQLKRVIVLGSVLFTAKKASEWAVEWYVSWGEGLSSDVSEGQDAFSCRRTSIAA